MPKHVVVIGAGFAGLSAASFMAKAGWKVTVIEKNEQPGGRARQWSADGFTFDMGPSWYWMPDVFERYFAQFNKSVSDYYQLQRLDPSYRIVWPDEVWDIPASLPELKAFFESKETGAAAALDQFLKEAAFKYEIGMNKLVYKPGLSVLEFADLELVKGVLKLDVFTSMRQHVSRFFKHPRLQLLMEFPVIFLGAMASHIPALYSLMNYADIVGGTWYPKGGMYEIVKAMYQLARDLGVEFRFNEPVTGLKVEHGKITAVETQSAQYTPDAVIGAGDYHHIETDLLQPEHQSYSAAYWNTRVMAPGCLLYYIGLNKKLTNVQHHTLFFDTDFERHANEIYTTPAWPTDPLFYMSVASVTDTTAAPSGGENLFLLVPAAAGLTNDTEQLREAYLQKLIKRLETHLQQPISDHIILKRTYAHADFLSDYNSFKGNAYGLANTLKQTAILKPSCRSKKLKNLYYAGQLTVPGPGVPPSLISGELAASELIRRF